MEFNEQTVCITILVILLLFVIYKNYYETFVAYGLTMEPAPLHVSRVPWTSGSYLRTATVDSASNRGVRDSGYIDNTRYTRL